MAAKQTLPPLESWWTTVPQEILRPVHPGFIWVTLFLGFLFDLLPLQGWWRALAPDLLALTLLFWCIREPMRVGVMTAWLFGFLVDVADGTLFGQHALAYALLAFAAEYFHRRVLRFPLWQQAMHVTILMLICQSVVLMSYFIGSGGTPALWTYFLPSLTAALVWPSLSVLLLLPQKPRIDPNAF